MNALVPDVQAQWDNNTSHIVDGIFPTLTSDTPNDGERDPPRS